MDSINDIKQLLQRLNSQVSRLEELKHDIPKIEIDITLELLRKIYEQVILVREIRTYLETVPEILDEPDKKVVDIPAPVPQVPVPAPEADVNTPPSVTGNIVHHLSEKDEESIEPEILAEPVKHEPAALTEKEKQVEIPVQEEPEVIQAYSEPEPLPKEPVRIVKPPVLDLFSSETVADKYKDNGLSVADKIKEQKKDRSVADKIQAGKITDIKSVIGINEKFLFINKLFDGSLKDYNNALENINQFENLEQVNNYLKIISDTFRWDPKNPALGMFKDLIGRRFL